MKSAARLTFRQFVYALYALTRDAQRDDALFVLMESVPMRVRRIGGPRGPYRWAARQLQRRWWGTENVR